MAKLQAIRGMNDILPAQSPVWQYLEATVRDLFRRYGYHEIRMPIVEPTELFKRSIGEVTDIVEKEMYTFDDRNGDSLTLRPEGTASCVRACEEHGLLFNQTRKLWYMGPMFRHERPQKGRYRQFHQMGVECFGLAGPDIDAELLIMTARLWRALGIEQQVRLEVNSLGSAAARAAYRDALVVYLQQYAESLDEESQRRLQTNPLRILDSKHPGTQAILEQAPRFVDFLDAESQLHFDQLLSLLDAAGLTYQVNPRLVRGLDYYGRTVFEWVTDSLGAQGTVCAGGRYDKLVEQLGGKPTPGVGFAMGVERLVLLLETLGKVPAEVNDHADLYLVTNFEGGLHPLIQLAEQLRDALPDQVVLLHCGGGSLKNQLKKADKSGARYLLILGESEWTQGQVAIKSLRGEQAANQQWVQLDQLIPRLCELMAE